MDLGKYTSFTTADLLADDEFIASVRKPTAESIRFWEQVAEQYPNVKPAIAQATKAIRSYRAQDAFTNEARQAVLWERITAEVGPPVGQHRALPLPVRRLPLLLRVAAAALPIGVATFFWYTQEQRFQTAFGEIKTVEMPDGTQVLLNGNSSLTYQRGWGKNSREVWLRGEGFFRVVHLNKDSTHIKPVEHFVVHCNDLTIEVLGTTFNVNNRHRKVDVGLVTGKIKLTNTSSPSPLVLTTGDYVEYTSQAIINKKKLIHPENLITWSKRQFIFTDVRLETILQSLEDSYGYQIIYTDDAAKQLRIGGEINVIGVAQLLETISTSLHVSVSQKGKQIVIH